MITLSAVAIVYGAVILIGFLIVAYLAVLGLVFAWNYVTEVIAIIKDPDRRFDDFRDVEDQGSNGERWPNE